MFAGLLTELPLLVDAAHQAGYIRFCFTRKLRLLMFEYLCAAFLEHCGDVTAVGYITSSVASRSEVWAVSVVEMQSCLARLYVSSTFRALARGDAQAAFAGYVLTGDEAAAIEAVDPHMLDIFATMLADKRRKRFERTYAASFAQHGAALHALLRRFLEIRPGSPAIKSHLDTLAFGRFAEETFAGHERYADWAGDLIRFERLSCEATFGQPAAKAGGAPDEDSPPPALADLPALLPGVVIDDYRYDVIALEAALRAGGTVPDDAAAARTTIVFRPGRHEDGQQMLRVNDATALVLRRCDGELTVGEIVAAVQSELRAPDLSGPIRDTIGRLQGLRVLSITGRRTRP